jgi:hypothetical protein
MARELELSCRYELLMEVECSHPMKSFVVNIRNGFVRSGLLKSLAQEIETPALIVHSRFGLPAYLSSDLLHNIRSQYALHVCIQDMYAFVIFY